MAHSFSEHKQHRHHYQSHMMKPCVPFANLIIRHTALAFSVLKRPLDPIALTLHPGQPFELGRLGCIAQRYLGLRILAQCLGGYQNGAFRLRRVFVPYIYRYAQCPKFKRPSAGLAQFQYRLIRKLKKLYNFFDLIASGVCSIAGEGTTLFISLLRYVGMGIVQVNRKIRMKINDKPLSHLIQGHTKSGAFSIAPICTYPAKPKTICPSVPNHFKCQRIFGVENTVRFGYAGFITPLPVFYPCLGKVESNIHRYCKTVFAKYSKYRHLAIIDFAKPAQLLPGNTRRHRPLFGKSAFVDEKAGLLIAQKFIRITGDLIDDILSAPLAVSQKLLKITRFRIRDHFGHPVHILARTRLHQTAGILPSLFCDIMTIGLKMVTVAFHEGHKTPPNTAECRLRGDIRFPPGFTDLSPGLIS